MKLSLIILFLFTLNDVFGQSRDSALDVFATDRKEWFVKEHNVPSLMIDGIRAKILSNGDTVVRASGGIFRSEEAVAGCIIVME